MNQREYDKERAVAAINPVGYIKDRQIFRLHEGGLPASLHKGWCRFWLFGIWPGSFLSAVIKNDLQESFARADDFNRAALSEIVSWFFNHGDTRALKGNAGAWSKSGGYFGLLKGEVENAA